MLQALGLRAGSLLYGSESERFANAFQERGWWVMEVLNMELPGIQFPLLLAPDAQV